MTEGDKTLRVRIHAKSLPALRKLPLHQVDMGCTGGVRVQKDESVILEALVRESLLDKLKSAEVRLEVLADAGEEGRKKQAQVGRGNRFKGKDRVPRGLGKKVRDGSKL